MNKGAIGGLTLKALYVLPLLAAAGLFTATEANARMGLSFNGRNLNGTSQNGRNLNGILLNGRNLNGTARQGTMTGQGLQATTVILKDGARVTLKLAPAGEPSLLPLARVLLRTSHAVSVSPFVHRRNPAGPLRPSAGPRWPA